MPKTLFTITLYLPDGSQSTYATEAYGFNDKSGALMFMDVTTEKNYATTLPFLVEYS